MANVTIYNWGTEQLGDAGGVITWSIVGGGEDIAAFTDPGATSVDPDSYLTINYVAQIAQAFAAWSTHGDIEFMQITDDGGGAGDTNHADIRIFFGDIPGSTIGIAYYPSWWGSAIAGDMLLDTDPKFNTSPTLFYAVTLHELGHSLGLGHVDDASIMTPVISETELQPDDIDGIQQLYGVQDNGPTAYALPTGQTDLVILDAPDDLTVTGNALDNRIKATGGAQTINGADGNDWLIGMGGADHLDGGLGDDKLQGGNGHDTLSGQDGNDRLVGGNGGDLMLGGAGNDTAVGGDGADTAQGDAGADFLRGGSGDDEMYGGDGDDRLAGGTHNDLLSGDAGNDRLSGRGGFDTLIGGSGDDRMAGGGNADRFVFAHGHGHDTITDFEATNDAEKLDFAGLSTLSDIADVLAAASDAGNDVVIVTGLDSSIRLQGVDLAFLDAADFLF